MQFVYIIILTFIIYLVISIYIITKSHEAVHREIFEARGYKTRTTLFCCDSLGDIKEQDKKDINILNDIADIIQYHAQAYWFVISLLVSITLIILSVIL